MCDASWEDISYDYYRTSELRVEEYRHPNTIRYVLRHMCGVDPATDPTFNEAVKQHFIQGGWLTAAQIAALKAKLNPSAGPVTGVESIQHSAISIQKVIRDGQIYIIRNGKRYTILGQQ